MSVMHDLAAEDIKELSFDRPETTDTPQPAVSSGTRVVLSHQGAELSAQVTAIERLGSSFVGRVLRFSPDAAPNNGPAPHDRPAPGDLIRFRLRDVIRTE